MRIQISILCLILGSLLAPAAQAQVTVTFDNGEEGWSGPSGAGGSTVIEATGGNPGAHLHTIFNDFGVTFVNSNHPDFVFDYTQEPTITLSIDLKVESIDFTGTPVPRPWLVELRDRDNPPSGFPWVSVWFKFADISQATHGDWTTFTVTVADTSVLDLPMGWGGFGAEDAQGSPMLPADRTFADVLAGIDEIAFTTLEPGFFFGFTDFDLRLDNISIDANQLFGDGFESGDTLGWSNTEPNDAEIPSARPRYHSL